jgi:hypothetical protein
VSRANRWLVRVLALSVVATPSLVAWQAPIAHAVEPGSLSAQPSPSWQTNATVWKLAYGHGDIWMVGDFTSVRPPGHRLGKGEHKALYFAALNASTGALDTAVNHTHVFSGQKAGTLPLTAGTVAVSPTGSKIYVGGEFTSVDGVTRNHIAAFSATTGDLLPWNPSVNGKVGSIATSGNNVYIGGSFTKVNGVTHNHIADVSATQPVPTTRPELIPWATGSAPEPSTDDSVDALAVTPDGSQVVAGGYFDKVDGLTESADGKTKYNKAVVISGAGTATAGALQAFPADHVVPPGTDAVQRKNGTGCSSDVKDIVISAGVAYFANEGTGIHCFDGTWAATLRSGTLKWVNRCLGATQAVEVVGDYLYKGSHAHDCRTTNTNGDPSNYPEGVKGGPRHLLSEKLSNGFLGPWYPQTNAGPELGPRAMATDGKQLYVGGDFTKVNNVGQQGLVRFTTKTDYAMARPGSPTVTSTRTGVVRITAIPPVDLDDPSLVMELFRNGGKKPIATADVTSLFWNRPAVHWVERGRTPNAHPVYRVRAVERYGTRSSPMSGPKQVTVDCARPAAVRAALVTASASRVSAKRRVVHLEVCTVHEMRVDFEVRRGSHVLAHTTDLKAKTGAHSATFSFTNHVARGKIRAYVVFTRGSHHKVAVHPLHLPR